MNEDDELKEEAAENKVKDTLNNGKSKVAKTVKTLFRLMMKKWGKWIALVVAVLILFVVLFNQFEKVIFKGVISDVKSAMGGEDIDGDGEPDIDFTSKAEIISKDGTYCLKVDKKVLEDIEKKLKEDNINPVDLNLEDFECFREFIKAEIATQYPQLGTIDKEKYKNSKDIITEGIIKIKRATPDKDTSQLFYKPLSEFQKLCDKNDSKALKYFSLTDDRKLVIASYEKTDVTVATSGDTSITEVPSEEHIYTITSQEIDYLSIVRKYTTPFSLLLAILQTSDSEEMALEFAKLVEESEIVITIQDNIEKNTYEESRNVEQHIEGTKLLNYTITKTEITVNSIGSRSVTTSSLEGPVTVSIPVDKQSKSCTVNVTTVIENNTPNLELTKVDCWQAKFERTYTYNDNTNNPDVTTSGPFESKKEDKVECDINSDADVTNYINGRINFYKSTIAVPTGTTVTISGSRNSLEADVKKITTTNTTIKTTTITKEFSTSEQKAESNEEKVFKIFRGEVAGNDKVLAKKLKEAYGSLHDAQLWFYGLLQSDSQAKDFVDIMKYLIKKFNNDKDAKEYDLDMYDSESFESAGGNGSISYESLKLKQSDLEILYKITSAERGSGTQEQQEYVVSVILNRVLSSGWPNTVKGVVFQKNQFEPTQNGAYEAAKPSATTKKAVNNVVKNGDTTANAPDNKEGLPAVYFMTPAAASSQSWLKNCVFLFNDGNGAANATHNFYTTKDVAKELEKYKTSENGEFLDVAKKCWEKVCKSKWNYGGSSIPCKGPNIDCSAYVSWVLYEYGYKEFKGWQTTTGPFLNTNWNKKYGWKEIKLKGGENPINKLKPGDLIVRHTTPNRGHITLVVSIKKGRINTYDCGSESHWLGNTTAKTCDSTYMLTDSRPGKVIRVTPPK